MTRLLPSLALFALASFGSTQECGATSSAVSLPSSPAGPNLTLPEGSPLVGGAFSAKILEGPALAPGIFAFSFNPESVYLPEFDATLHLSLPLSYSEGFVTNDQGGSPVLFEIPSIDPNLCGVELTFQAVVQDLAAPGGLVFTEGIQAVVGSPQDTIVLTRANVDANLKNMYTTGNTHAGGTAWIDYNGDLWPDLFVSNGGGWRHYLYRNEGDGTFTEVSNLIPKVDLSIEDGGAKFGDVDNDGDTDLLVFSDNPVPVFAHEAACETVPCNPNDGGPNHLYMNQGNGQFLEQGLPRGIVDAQGRRNNAAGFADYDRDGYIDLYLGNWALYSPPDPAPDVNSDVLLHNDGDGSFTDVTAAMGLDNNSDSLTCLWFDVEMDGWPDLYIGNASNHVSDAIDAFYLNQSGTSLVDSSATLPWVGDDAIAAMGMDVGDIDNDGDWDVYITDNRTFADPPGNPLYLGNPDGTLSENVAQAAGIGCVNSWPCNFIDFNRDGWVDLWVGTIGTHVRDYMFVNNQDGTFDDVVLEAFTDNDAKGGSAADYDGDGDVDIVLWNQKLDSCLLRNDSTDTNGWMEFKLYGDMSNRDAIGATVHITGGGITQMRRVTGGDSAHSQSEAILHFGVAQVEQVDVRVDWPSGLSQQFAAVDTNQLVRIHETDGILTEELIGATASYAPQSDTLRVEARTTFRGRTTLSIDGYGTLGYDAANLRFASDFVGAGPPPASVTLTSESGGSWEIPVTQ